MLPTPMLCSIDESISTSCTLLESAAAYRSCASTRSITVSGSGPSSRMLPASTNSTLFFTHSYMTPDFSTPVSTAARMLPARLIVLIAAM